jgi:hypothetical protein
MSTSTNLAKIDIQTKHALATIDAMTQAIANITTIGEAKVAISESRKFQLHVREYKLGREAMLRGCEASLRAELQAGLIAIALAKNPDYGKILEEARLENGQVNRWRREVESIGEEIFTQEAVEIGPELEKAIAKYIQSIRENPDEAQFPTFRGFLAFRYGKDDEEHQKEDRTELTKQFCHFYPIERAQAEVNLWLSDSGRSQKEKLEIASMWKRVLEKGNLFKNQASIEDATCL